MIFHLLISISARLIFHHGTVSSGKSLNLISFADSLLRRNKKVYCTKPQIDTRTTDIYSRVGVNIEINCDLNNLESIFNENNNFKNSNNENNDFNNENNNFKNSNNENNNFNNFNNSNNENNDCDNTLTTDSRLPNFSVSNFNQPFNQPYNRNIFRETIYLIIDESQFLSIDQINRLRSIANNPQIEIHCYGLKTDFKSQLFPGSKRLIEVSDKIEEIKTKCTFCDMNAIMNIKHCGNKVMKEGESVELGFEEMYLPVCYVCYSRAIDSGYLPGTDKENLKNFL
ncbi:Thymidine kinase [Dictyocoela muelleri]|nr:Thymidine kinase [Dictyocoela muelleri]